MAPSSSLFCKLRFNHSFPRVVFLLVDLPATMLSLGRVLLLLAALAITGNCQSIPPPPSKLRPSYGYGSLSA